MSSSESKYPGVVGCLYLAKESVKKSSPHCVEEIQMLVYPVIVWRNESQRASPNGAKSWLAR
jgi:hypothetical protein